jgi:hypothetical protein
MTITFQGHVQSLTHTIDNEMIAEVVPEARVCEHTIKLRIPKTYAATWAPGNMVQITAYAMPAAKKEQL